MLQTRAVTLSFCCFSPLTYFFPHDLDIESIAPSEIFGSSNEGRGQPRIIAGIVNSNSRFVKIYYAIFTKVQWAFLLGVTLWCLWKVASCH